MKRMPGRKALPKLRPSSAICPELLRTSDSTSRTGGKSTSSTERSRSLICTLSAASAAFSNRVLPVPGPSTRLRRGSPSRRCR